MHRTTTVLLAALLLAGAAVGCSSSGDDKADAKPRATATVTATATATPLLSRDEIKRQCSDAVAEAAPGWEDWNFAPGAWADDPRTPKPCLLLKDEADPSQGNRDFMGALIDGLNVADDPRASQ